MKFRVMEIPMISGQGCPGGNAIKLLFCNKKFE